MSTTFQYNSFLGAFNFFKKRDTRTILDKGERPPYPIILSNATMFDVIGNLNKADLGFVLFFAAIGFFY